MRGRRPRLLAYNEIVKGLDVESMGLVQLPLEAFAPKGAAMAGAA